MYWKFKIIRVVERAITWFFEEEIKTIGCRNINEVNNKLQKGDKVFKLAKGEYIPYTINDEIERALKELNKSILDYNNCNSIQTPNNYDDHWNRNDDIKRIIKTITNSNWD